MFDIGFSEIVVIGVVALVVIGPERLPKTARTVGLLFGRLQRYVSEVKADISREMELDELRKLRREMQGAANEFEQSVKTAANDFTTGVRSVEHELNNAASEVAAPATAVEQKSAPAATETADAPKQGALPGFDKI